MSLISANSLSVAGVSILSVVVVTIGVISGGKSVSTCISVGDSGTGTPTLARRLHNEPDSTDDDCNDGDEACDVVDVVCKVLMMVFNVVPRSSGVEVWSAGLGCLHFLHFGSCPL